MQRCVYGIVHPDDHHELKTVLEGTLSDGSLKLNNQRRACCRRSDGRPVITCRTVSFFIRIKCFNGTTTGYLVRKTYFRTVQKEHSLLTGSQIVTLWLSVTFSVQSEFCLKHD